MVLPGIATYGTQKICLDWVFDERVGHSDQLLSPNPSSVSISYLQSTWQSTLNGAPFMPFSPMQAGQLDRPLTTSVLRYMSSPRSTTSGPPFSLSSLALLFPISVCPLTSMVFFITSQLLALLHMCMPNVFSPDRLTDAKKAFQDMVATPLPSTW